MKKIIIFIFLFCIPVIALAKMPLSSNTGVVTHITDGDTIKIQIGTGTETIRLLGVDTPEKFPTRFGYSECFGEESTRFVEDILPIGTQVYIEYYGNDRYSRDLANIYIGSKTGALLADEIIKNGYGWVYRKGIKSGEYKRLIKSEALAKRQKIGLWNRTTCNGKRMKAPEKTQTETSNIENKTPIIPSSPLPSTQTETSKNYYSGPNGGCYYYSTKGTKIYVARSLCK